MTATLTLAGIDRLPSNPDLRRRVASQWFTPPDIAARMVDWCGNVGGVVLEPSAGSGALLDAWIARCEGDDWTRNHATTRVDVVEMDASFADLIAGADYGDSVRVECADYLTRPPPPSRYALCLTNPPYEDGNDGRFLAKAMDECDRVVALVRLAALAGKERHASVWSRVESHADGWWMPGLAFFSSRPVFDGPESACGSAKSDFVCVKLSRLGTPSRTAVEWW